MHTRQTHTRHTTCRGLVLLYQVPGIYVVVRVKQLRHSTQAASRKHATSRRPGHNLKHGTFTPLPCCKIQCEIIIINNNNNNNDRDDVDSRVGPSRVRLDSFLHLLRSTSTSRSNRHSQESGNGPSPTPQFHLSQPVEQQRAWQTRWLLFSPWE